MQDAYEAISLVRRYLATVVLCAAPAIAAPETYSIVSAPFDSFGAYDGLSANGPLISVIADSSPDIRSLVIPGAIYTLAQVELCSTCTVDYQGASTTGAGSGTYAQLLPYLDPISPPVSELSVWQLMAVGLLAVLGRGIPIARDSHGSAGNRTVPWCR
jgi:hypothetical protein